MRNFLLAVSAFLFLVGCSSDSDGGSGECGTITLTNVVQQGNQLVFNYQTQNTFNYYEIGYDVTTNLTGVSNDQLYFNYGFTTTDVSSTTREEDFLAFFAEENQTLSFYIRAQCSNGELTKWNGPIVLQIEEYCESPTDLNAFGSGVSWNFDGNNNASYYQVEYGLHGFNLGEGSQITTSDTSTHDAVMAQGNTYDFYVRAFCENGLGFGNWSGPVSVFADQDYNLCTPPSNVVHEIEYNFFGDPVGVVFRWDFNGESMFEHVLVSDGFDPNNTTSVNTSDGSGWPVYGQGLFQNTPYDFYIRAVCVDGSRTEWVGPKNIVIN
ncbi:hypothetical protein [Winogradskyella sp.]|jgi:hypothetical protein|uniref:hypothetical protein n=1 Tax=Winogradskyella sp. TaxID=1883156 RepID=UPI0025D67139|nr:hypothetical protein [Winogradskyella sp.]MCT4630826.1 hypothetical protein [Winogradskyella sp.]